MYALNPLPTNVLITPDEVLRYFAGNAIDPNIFSAVIQVAETRFAIPLLGYPFYQQLCAQKNIAVTAANQATLQAMFPPTYNTLQPGNIVNAIDLVGVSPENAVLWNTVLWPFIAQCVLFTALPGNYAKFTSSGIIRNNPNPMFVDESHGGGTSTGITLSDLKYLRNDVLLQNISVMQEAVEKFICTNQSDYPLIPRHSYSKWEKDSADTRKTGLIFLYDDESDEPCSNVSVPAPASIPQTRACTLVLNIVATPDPSQQYLLCNLQTIPLEYPAGNTLIIPHLIGKIVNPNILIGLTPCLCPTDPATGTLDNTAGGGFPAGTTVIINYNELVG